jgi:hypothetical protein
MVLLLQPLRFGLPIAPAEPTSNSQCEERNFWMTQPMYAKMEGFEDD